MGCSAGSFPLGPRPFRRGTVRIENDNDDEHDRSRRLDCFVDFPVSLVRHYRSRSFTGPWLAS